MDFSTYQTFCSQSSHQSAFEAADEAGDIPGAALVVDDATGKFRYAKAFSRTANGETMSLERLMWIASSTKLLTSVAALQQVEQSHIGLDDDIPKVLLEFGILVDSPPRCFLRSSNGWCKPEASLRGLRKPSSTRC
ncbi:hypothetical protein GGR53DRAFT_465000 [Hypoxylon sp. FL1150]|nr:hypothetical protein GGR53DRAFT_465000 [Hypoxylon sp. FL1150]